MTGELIFSASFALPILKGLFILYIGLIFYVILFPTKTCGVDK